MMNEVSILERYGEDLIAREYITDPAIARDEEIKQVILTLLTPEKSALLVGKAGVGKTAIVEGLAYLIQRNEVPDALKGYTIIKVDTQSLIGTVKETGDSRVQTLVNEMLENEKYILFIDEIHTLINATSDSALDFAQMFKTGLGRGDIKVIGATTTDEYEKYILRDKAFTRRFQKIEIAEPDVELTVKIVTGVIPRIEKNTGIKMGYSPYIWEKLARFITEVTTEYNRIYESAGRYPDVAITMFSNAFSEALFDNQKIVTAKHIRKAIENSKTIYPDVIKKYLPLFDEQFKNLLEENPITNDEIKNNQETNNIDSTPQEVNNETTIDSAPQENNTEIQNSKPKNNNITTIDELNKIYNRISNPFEALRKDK